MAPKPTPLTIEVDRSIDPSPVYIVRVTSSGTLVQIGTVSAAGVWTPAGPSGAPFAASAFTDATNASNISSGVLPAGRLPALTGDVAVAAGTTTTTIQGGVVMNTNLAVTMPPLTVKANITNGTAGPTDPTFTAALDAAFGSTRGSILYRGAGGWAQAAPGAAGTVWTSSGAGSDPSYAAVGQAAQLPGFRNRVNNGDMRIDQRNNGAAQTITGGAALAYTVDRFYAYSTGANATGQRVAGSGSTQYRYQITGAAGVTAIGFGQRIEQASSFDLAGGSATLSVDLANSVLTSVTWTAYYANTADAFGTLASPTRTQIATGTFTVSSTLSRYTTSITIPAAATSGIEIVFSVGAQTSGTWVIGNVQLEPGAVATVFEKLPLQTALALAQRRHIGPTSTMNSRTYGAAAGAGYDAASVAFPVTMAGTPTIVFSSISYNNTSGLNATSVGAYGFAPIYSLSAAGNASVSFSYSADAEL